MGLAARQALGRSSWFGIAYEKNQLTGFHGIKVPQQLLSPLIDGGLGNHASSPHLGLNRAPHSGGVAHELRMVYG